MTDETPLDRAFAAMEAAPEDDAARLRFYERLADGELLLLLTREAEDERLDPEIFEVGDARFLLVFDRAERLAGFVGRPAAFAGLSGRTIAGMLTGQGIGLGLNLGAPSEHLLPPEAVDWLAATLGHAPEEAEARPEEVFPPAGLPEVLITALDAKLARAAGLARRAYLVGVAYEGGARGHLLGLTGAVPGAEGALARAINEALVFSGLEAGALDVAFLRDDDPLAARLARVGLRFDLPEPAEAPRPRAPGSDPDAPPKLR